MSGNRKFKIIAIIVLACILAPSLGIATIGAGTLLGIVAVGYLVIDLLFGSKKKEKGTDKTKPEE